MHFQLAEDQRAIVDATRRLAQNAIEPRLRPRRRPAPAQGNHARAEHPLAAQFMTVVPIKEGHLPLRLGAIVRQGGMLKPALWHFVAHLHRTAQVPCA
ncbi:MAG: hypothetical protein DI587_09415 [Variovorax paradoxus]|nr:MAG: hypothetical protein DI583_09415 [Variovorax paradoxus]PZQ12211.1 MAG: hypothetical protein DI587_09415 [Variovorax paradoxus]